jgi:hypothetical protein
MSTLLFLIATFRSTAIAFTPIPYRSAQLVSPVRPPTTAAAFVGFLPGRPQTTSPARGRLGAGTALADLSSSDTSTDVSSNDTDFPEVASSHAPSSSELDHATLLASGPGGAPALVTTNPRELIRRLSMMVSSSRNYETTLRSAVAAQRLFTEFDQTSPSLNTVLLIWGKVAQQLTEWHHSNESTSNQETAVVAAATTDQQRSEEDGSDNGGGIDSILDEYLKDVDIREVGVYTSKDAAMQAQALLEKHMVLATTNSYNSVMECWTKSRDEIAPEQVQALYDKIKNPDEASNNALVEAYAYCKNVNNRLVLMEGLPVSYSASSRTCNALLHAYSKAASSATLESDRMVAEIADKALEALEALKTSYSATGDVSQRPDIMSYTTGTNVFEDSLSLMSYLACLDVSIVV